MTWPTRVQHTGLLMLLALLTALAWVRACSADSIG
jgi:hypothetical protein